MDELIPDDGVVDPWLVTTNVTRWLLEHVSNGTTMPTSELDLNTSVSTDISAAERFRDESRFWIQRVFLPLLVCVGVLGNAATMVVLTRRGMRSSTNVYLSALAFADLLYLIFIFTLSFIHYPTIRDGTSVLVAIYWHYWRFGLWLTDATSSTSVWLIVSFTVERYIAVCHPMRGKVLCTESRAQKVTAAVYIACFLATASTPFEWVVVESLNPDTNQTEVVGVDSSDLAMNESYRTGYYWFSSVTFVLFPLVLLAVFNTFLILAVKRSRRTRRRMTSTSVHHKNDTSPTAHQTTQENKITVTLIAVVILFMLCQLPTAVTLIYKSFTAEPEVNSDEEALLRALGNFFNLLMVINAASNFLLYCALSDRYRRTFARTFLPFWYRRWYHRRRRQRHPSPVHSLSQYSTVCMTTTVIGDQMGSSPVSVRLNRAATVAGGNNRNLLTVPRNGSLQQHRERQSQAKEPLLLLRLSTPDNDKSLTIGKCGDGAANYTAV